MSKVIGYTAGVFDLFHIGHVNLLKRAKSECDYLIVAVTSDQLTQSRKGRCVIPQEERMTVVEACRYADKVVLQEDMNKYEAWIKYRFNKLFVGDDWKNSREWIEWEALLGSQGVPVIYFPYTRGTSSSLINSTLERLRKS
jgi:glycerol-3-phosphate cytidylyltransferase